MAKKDGANIRKADYAGLRRVTKSDGSRVWLFDGIEFDTKRQVYAYAHPAPVKLPDVAPADTAANNDLDGTTVNPK